MGNSEVGHLNLGAGAVVKQDITRIDDAVADGSLRSRTRCSARPAARRRARRGRLHLLGPGVGRRRAREHGPPARAGGAGRARGGAGRGAARLHRRPRHEPRLGRRLPGRGGGLGAACGWPSVTGRYFAMDRDRRWDRTKLAWDAIVHGRADVPPADSGEEAVRAAYERGETDEFIQPTLVGEEGRIRDGDTVVFFNFRPDRARQLTRALGEDDFAEFDRGERPRVALATLTSYQEDWDYPVAFPPARPAHARLRARRARVRPAARGRDREVRPRDLLLQRRRGAPVPRARSAAWWTPPRDVATYDEKPEMSAEAAAAAFVERWEAGVLGFGVINFANPDMVGHTGDIPAAVRAIETVDRCLGRVVEAVHGSGRRLHRHRRPRQRRPHAEPGRQPEHRPLDEPGAARGDRGRGGPCATAECWPTWRPRCWTCSGSRSAGGDDGSLARAERRSLLHRRPRRVRPRGRPPYGARRRGHAGLRAAGLHGHREDAPVVRGRRPGLRHGAGQHLPPLHPARARADRRARRPPRVHGLGRRDRDRLGRLPGVLDGPRLGGRGDQALAAASASR